ncbi:MAG: DUF3971 domain-containing protein [Alphaproteobacteria bacterium]
MQEIHLIGQEVRRFMGIHPFLQPVNKTLKFLGRLLISVFLGAVGVLVLLLLFLSQRPLPLDPWVPWMQNHVGNTVQGLTFQRAQLNWRRWDSPFEIQFQEIQVSGQGLKTLKLDKLGVRLSLKNLLSGNVWVQGLTIPHPELLWRAFSGNSTFSGGRSGNPEAAIKAFLQSEFWQHLEEIELTDIHLPLPLKLDGLSFYPPPFHVHLYKKGPATLGFNMGYQGEKAFLKGDVRFLPQQGQLAFSANWKDWRLRLAPRERIFKPVMHWLAQIPLLSGSLEGAYDVSKSRLAPIRINLQTSEGNFTFSPEAKGDPQTVSFGKSHLSLHLMPEKITLTDGVLALEDKTFSLKGEALLPKEKSVQLKLQLLGEVPLPFLQKIWPQQLAIKPRTWIFKNLSDGKIHTVDLLYKPGNDLEKQDFSGSMALEGLTVDYLTGMPKAREVSGKATFDTKNFSIAFSHAMLEDQALEKGSLVIDGLDQVDQTLSTVLEFKGPIPDLLEIISQKPLEYPQKFDLVPKDFKGSSKTLLKLKFPLESDLELEEIQVTVEASLSNVEVALDVGAQEGAKLPIQKGMLKLFVSPQKLQLEGPAVVNSHPAKIQWEEIFGEKKSSRYQLTYTLTPDFLSAFGLNVKSFAEGSASASLIYEKKGAAAAAQKGSLSILCDLKAAKLEVPLLNWKKPSGEEAQLRTSLDVLKNGDFHVRGLTLTSKQLHLEGSAKLAPDHTPKEVLISKIQAPKWRGQASFHVRNQGKQRLYEVKLGGKEADLFPLLKSPFSQKSFFKQGDRLSVQLEFDQVHGAHQQAAKNVTASLKGRQFLENFGWETVVASGYLPSMRKTQMPPHENEIFLIEWKPKQEGTSLEVRSYQAGRFLKFANIYPNVISGELLLTASRASLLDPFKGRLRIKNFRVLEMPTLLHLLSLAPLFNFFEMLSPKEGMLFDSLSAYFSADLANSILVHKALARNKSIGIFFQGFLKPPQNSIALEGSMAPAYLLYQLLSKIPLLGDFLFGIQGRGLLATHFAIKGPIDNPVVEVNPLSSFAPGFLQGPSEDPS